MSSTNSKFDEYGQYEIASVKIVQFLKFTKLSHKFQKVLNKICYGLTRKYQASSKNLAMDQQLAFSVKT